MAGYLSKKLKRKDLDDVNEDFSDFSLSSPARKIRRLGGDLPPIMEEEEPEMPVIFEKPPQIGGDVLLENMPCDMANEERAIVLFKPMTSGPVHFPSNFSVPSHLVSRFKNDLWSRQYSRLKPLKEEDEEEEDETHNKNCMSLIPWVPSQAALGQEAPHIEEAPMAVMDVDAAEAMEIEDTGANLNSAQGQANGFYGMIGNEGLHQWHQQQCMTPQLPVSSTSPPIFWYP